MKLSSRIETLSGEYIRKFRRISLMERLQSMIRERTGRSKSMRETYRESGEYRCESGVCFESGV
jgi:GTP1/Obg family GTP-binding protein